MNTVERLRSFASLAAHLRPAAIGVFKSLDRPEILRSVIQVRSFVLLLVAHDAFPFSVFFLLSTFNSKIGKQMVSKNYEKFMVYRGPLDDSILITNTQIRWLDLKLNFSKVTIKKIFV